MTVTTELRSFAHFWSEQVQRWREEDTRHTEKSYAQQFWSDLLRCFGVIPERIDLFERDAHRATTGRSGYIDLFWTGVVIGEAKSLGKDLDLAEKQALDYLSGGSIGQHEFPKFVLVSDFANIQLTRLGDEGWTIRFGVEEAPDYIDQLMFLAGREEVTKKEEEEASIHASNLMADLFRAMLGDEIDEPVGDEAAINPEDEEERLQRTSVWMTRLLFLLFGDDAGLWEEDLFYRYLLFETRPETLGAQLNSLFQTLNTPEDRRPSRLPETLAKFPYVNGSVFADHLPQEFFDDEMREALLAACRFHWTRISPAVFGSMFQLVKSKEARRTDGEHYTSEKNILKVLEPLFLDELREQAARLIRNKSTSATQLRKFRDSLAEMTFLDPACGCGNFLVIAYRELRTIETNIITALRKKEGQRTGSLDVSLDQKLTIDQFHGFEINWWPAKIAETAMFLVDHQANRELADAIGDAPDRLPIEITAHIHHSNALEMSWNEKLQRSNTTRTGKTYVFGNPPFIGARLMDGSQKEGLKHVAPEKVSVNDLDYVAAWFFGAANLLEGKDGELAFVATNSISHGVQPIGLFKPLFNKGWRIKLAHQTFAWDSEAPGKASVHCVIVGLTREASSRPRLWTYESPRSDGVEVPVDNEINGYLVNGPRVFVKPQSKPISLHLPKVNFGSMANDGKGGFKISPKDYDLFMADPVAKKYVRPFVGAQELLHDEKRWCLWMVDLDPADLAKSSLVRSRIEWVKAARLKTTRAATNKLAATPHLFGEIRQPETPYVCIPRHVQEDRPYFLTQHFDAEVIAGDANFTADDPDGLLFALISSSMFITWQRTVGGRLESRLRFAGKVTWNTFPVPAFSHDDQEAITKAGRAVLKARAIHPERSLANQYNPLAMDPALVRAHDALDRVVDKAFGAPRKLTIEEQRLEILFTRYSEMTN
ncbi:MAG: class I SAM-dependent DNA methyltransferase [Micrococcaceae bacterium]|nr:class I SAM-dependent DNA methyltransferase [Micrococcaceae bacterium]